VFSFQYGLNSQILFKMTSGFKGLKEGNTCVCITNSVLK
jgi:hypothetical protein